MAFAGVSLIVDGKLCPYTESPVDAHSDSGYHLLVVHGHNRTTKDTPNGRCIKCRPFIVGGHRWILSLYPNGEHEGVKEFISISLDLCEDKDVLQPVLAKYVISYIDQTDLQVPTRIKSRQAFDFSRLNIVCSNFVRRDVLERSRHLKNDSFTIRCDVIVDTDAERATSTHRAPPFIQMPPPKMDSHFSDLLLTKEGTDITFEVGGEKFAAHRCVLAAWSTVFKAQLFGNGILEAGATVKIDGMEAKVFSLMLTFIYTDAMPYMVRDRRLKEDEGEEEQGNSTGKDGSGEEEAETDQDEAETDEEEAETDEEEAETQEIVMWRLHLLEAADRYDLQGLKMSCEESLARFIRVSTVADIIVAAEQRQCRWLKEVCLEFIRSHTSLHAIFTPEGFEQMTRTCSTSGLKELISKFVS